MNQFKRLQQQIIQCRMCPRLAAWREDSANIKTRRFTEWEYWGRPVPGFGDQNAQVLIVGLAPAAHGANRTGRMFTGDESGNWLYKALYKYGFANQPTSISRDDGLVLHNCFISAACRCAPPKNKPTSEEMHNCRPFLLEEMRLLKNIRVIIGLGKIGFDTAFDAVKVLGWTGLTHRPKFSHGVNVKLRQSLFLVGSYHPSQQNTFTGKLTEPMFNRIFTIAKEIGKNTI